MTLAFKQLPLQIQKLYRGREADCICNTRMVQGVERYYVNTGDKTAVYAYDKGWKHIRDIWHVGSPSDSEGSASKG